jgi:hypothetical protein
MGMAGFNVEVHDHPTPINEFLHIKETLQKPLLMYSHKDPRLDYSTGEFSASCILKLSTEPNTYPSLHMFLHAFRHHLL